MNWSCFHVFLSDPLKLEAFILQWLAPKAKAVLSEGKAQQWFFMRYWEGGPHVRVRFLNLEDEASVLAEFRQAARQYQADEPMTAEQYYANHQFDGEPVDIATLPWYGDGNVEMIDYEPEIERYGGKAAILVNEQVFHTSSDLALAVMNSTVGNIDKRLQISLVLMVNSIFAFKPSIDSLQAFCSFYKQFWLGHADPNRTQKSSEAASREMFNTIERLRQEVESNSAKGAPALWVAKLKQAIGQFGAHYQQGELTSPITGATVASDHDFEGAVVSMIGSQIHMLNNRMGVTPAYEYYLSAMILDAIEQGRKEG